MTPSFPVRKHLFLAGALGAILLTTSWPLLAQQTPEAPPPWAQGRPAQPGAAMNLAPVAPPPIPAAADQLPKTSSTGCRVGPGNFTPSPSQIRTGYSRIIRLVTFAPQADIP